MKSEYRIEACRGAAIEAKAGQTVTVTDLEGGQVVDFFAVCAEDADEFLSAGVTIDCNESLGLRVGDAIYSSKYRPMFRVLYDDVGVHDLLHPCCRSEMYDFFYKNGAGHPNCLDNINAALGTSLPIVHPINLFMNTAVAADGKLTVAEPVSAAGDKIVLRALCDVRMGVAACSVSESLCNGGKCTAVCVAVEDGGQRDRIE